jgi:Trm5-related predicted tRNA methylase
MDKLFTRPEKNEREIRRALGEMRLFVNQDPLYLTYLQPEIIDINGLEKMKDEYVRGDLVRVKQIVKRILKKIQHVDRTAGNADLRGAA